MMIQTAPAGARQFAITMDDHTALAGQFARAFGNERFEAVEPRDLVLYVIDNHDKGWIGLDAVPTTDCKTGFPYNLIDTPIADIVKTSTGSPDFNEKRHPYCGLLSSMHSWGLYNGRYGMSDKVLIDWISPQDRQLAMCMLDDEIYRQRCLKKQLAGDPATADWIEDEHLLQNYKQLQFFDTLALYFNRTHDSARRGERFEHVPLNAREDTTVTITPTRAGTYAMSPYPFGGSPVSFQFSGRYLQAAVAGTDTDWVGVFSRTPIEQQIITLIAG